MYSLRESLYERMANMSMRLSSTLPFEKALADRKVFLSEWKRFIGYTLSLSLEQLTTYLQVVSHLSIHDMSVLKSKCKGLLSVVFKESLFQSLLFAWRSQATGTVLLFGKVPVVISIPPDPPHQDSTSVHLSHR